MLICACENDWKILGIKGLLRGHLAMDECTTCLHKHACIVLNNFLVAHAFHAYVQVPRYPDFKNIHPWTRVTLKEKSVGLLYCGGHFAGMKDETFLS